MDLSNTEWNLLKSSSTPPSPANRRGLGSRFRNPLRLALAAALCLACHIRADVTPGIRKVAWEVGVGARITVEGPPGTTAILEGSDDLISWTEIERLTFQRGSLQAVDYSSERAPRRFFRVRPDSRPAPAEPAEETSVHGLDDLALQSNRVFIPSEGFNALERAPDGRLGLLLWNGSSLILRERIRGQDWRERVVYTGRSAFAAKGFDEHRFQPHAALLYDSRSRPHVLIAVGSQLAHQYRDNGQWLEAPRISPPGGISPALFVAAFGPADQLHFAWVNEGASTIQHGANVSGNWRWSRVASTPGSPRGFLRQSYAPRFFSMAVDSKNVAHLTFTRFEIRSGPGGYPKPYSELVYASNRGGQWTSERLDWPSDGSGEAGVGASIAIAPDDQPAIASCHNSRADTGSSQGTKLLFHRRNSGGGWSVSEVAGAADQYNAGDGDRGAGFAPQLRFDSRGRAMILFSDHAAEHFWASGQNEYAGQIRLAVWNGSGWSLRTVLRQTRPWDKQIIYPAMAFDSQTLLAIGLERRTVWGPDSWPRQVSSSYHFVFREIPLP